MRKTIIALNGRLRGEKCDYQQIIESGERIFFIAADGGAIFLDELGYLPDVIIGDLDSLTEKKIKEYRSKDVKILRFPVEKDETDAELTLNYCQEKGLRDIIILGSMGGRFDQQLANVYLLEYAYRNGLNAVIKEPGIEVGIIKEKQIFRQKNNYSLSLIPLDKKVKGVYTSGFKYRLDGEELKRFKTRGISNKIVKRYASVLVEKGILLYVLNKNISPSC